MTSIISYIRDAVPKNSPDRFKIMYLMLAFFCLIVILAVSVVVIRFNSNTNLEQTVISNSERIADSIYFTEVDAISIVQQERLGYNIEVSPSAYDQLDVRIRDMYDPLNIVKVLVLNKQKAVIYSNDKKLIGLYENGKEREGVFENGKVFYRLQKHQTIVDLVGERRDNIDIAEVYIPIKHKSGSIIGSFAVYSDVTRLIANHRQQMIYSVFAQSAVVLLISLISYLIIVRESAELKSAYQKMSTLATTDPLTGICNRRELLERAEQHFAMLQRKGNKLAESVGLGLIMIDVDFFKQVNDKYGHLAGDSILKELVGQVASTLRQYDVFGRYGGEEFLVLLPNTHPEEVRQIAQRILESAREHTFEWGKKPLKITLSIGATWTDAANESLDIILTRADGLMYVAKKQGRNQVVFHVDRMIT